MRVRVYGSTDGGGPLRPRGSTIDRIWAKVDKSGDCWIWTGSTKQGYAVIWDSGVRKVQRVTRIIMSENGAIPDGMVVCHRCDNPPCVRPDHLFLGTKSDNARDMVAKGRQAPTRGEDNPRSILTEAQVIEMRAMRQNGASLNSCARAFGVSKRTALDVVSRRHWKHIQ